VGVPFPAGAFYAPKNMPLGVFLQLKCCLGEPAAGEPAAGHGGTRPPGTHQLIPLEKVRTPKASLVGEKTTKAGGGSVSASRSADDRPVGRPVAGVPAGECRREGERKTRCGVSVRSFRQQYRAEISATRQKRKKYPFAKWALGTHKRNQRSCDPKDKGIPQKCEWREDAKMEKGVPQNWGRGGWHAKKYKENNVSGWACL
jgi:hypothetical protein